MAYAGIPATVLQQNDEQFFCDGCQHYGQTRTIPCGNDAAKIDNAIRWAVPVNNDFIKGFKYVIANTAPTFDSIRVFKLTNILNGYWWMVVGTQDAYRTQCAACCDTSPIPSLLTSPLPQLSTQQLTCPDSSGAYVAYFGLPFRDTGNRYVGVVTSGNPYTQLSPIQTYASGSTSAANFVTYLNTNYGALGTWSLTQSPLGVKLVAASAIWVGLTVCSKSS